jgi:hypothetical protein
VELLDLILNVLMTFGGLTDKDPVKRRNAWIGCGLLLAFLVVVVLIAFVRI